MKFRLAFALHNHQPVGNFSAVFEEAHTKCYQPFLELIKKYPRVKFSLHQSGILWNWQKEHHPDFFTLVGEMVDNGQAELLTGAFYEPILPAIPDRDKLGQIRMLSTFLKDHFEVIPCGMWLAERVWEPHLPRIITECGIHYLPLDDTHFKYAGLKAEQLYGTYVTEEAGKTVVLLPILEKLRYLIPFGEPEEVIDFLSQAAGKHPDGLAIYADDGEKFGIWPDTHKHCYLDGWLERFFSLLQENSDWLEVISLGEAVTETKPIGRIYLPSASYSEMLHWALPSECYNEYEDFEKKLEEHDLLDKYGYLVRGGHWRGFLAKYPESNLMHKEMLAVSDLLDRVSILPNIDTGELENARDLLYAGQCNCPYWHGVFGGLYIPHLRWAIYKKLIEAEKILRRLSDTVRYADFGDYDRDGLDDIALGGDNLSMVICPGRGGQIIELVSIDNNINVADCMTRRKEGYHRKLAEAKTAEDDISTKSIHDIIAAKEEGLEGLLVDDWYLRRPLTDRFLADGTTLNNFMAGKYYELGDFILEPFETDFSEDDNYYRITLTRHGHVWQRDFHCPMFLEKLIIFPKNGNMIEIRYRLLQHDLEIMPLNFGVEFDFNLLAPAAEDRYTLIDGVRPEDSRLAATAETGQASRVTYLDEYQNVGIQLDADQPGRLWRMPIYTVSLSESGFEKVFQGNCTLFLFDRALPAGKEFLVNFRLFTGPLEKMPSGVTPGRCAVNLPEPRN